MKAMMSWRFRADSATAAAKYLKLKVYTQRLIKQRKVEIKTNRAANTTATTTTTAIEQDAGTGSETKVLKNIENTMPITTTANRQSREKSRIPEIRQSRQRA
jgi:hypothetical protein